MRKKSSAAGSASRRVIGQRTACITISRISGEAARMRTRSPAAGTSGGSNSTEIVVTEACSVAWWRAPGGDPCRLVRRQEVGAVGRVDLDRAVDRVFDLVEIVVVPAGGQPLALVHEAAARSRAPPSRRSTQPEVGRSGRPMSMIIDRLCRDGHTLDRIRRES